MVLLPRPLGKKEEEREGFFPKLVYANAGSHLSTPQLLSSLHNIYSFAVRMLRLLSAPRSVGLPMNFGEGAKVGRLRRDARLGFPRKYSAKEALNVVS